MKCKDCNSTLCSYRTSDAEKDCFYESHPDYPIPRDLWNDDNTDWQALRNQAAIAAMQGFIQSKNTEFYSLEDVKKWQKVIIHNSIVMADALIEELKKR